MILRTIPVSACLLAVLIGLCVPCSGSFNQTEVSLIQLIATPEKFDGRVVSVVGYLRIERDGDVLYLHSEDYERGIPQNGIWVQRSDAVTKNDALNGNYVLVTGTFSAKRSDRPSPVEAGAIVKITLCVPWSAARKGPPKRGEPLAPR